LLPSYAPCVVAERNDAVPRRSKTAAQSTPALVPSSSRYPEISFESAKVQLIKSDLKSVASEIRTKPAQSGGLETNGPREGIFGIGRCGIVWRFACEVRGYWASMRTRKPAETIGLRQGGGGSGIRTHVTVSRKHAFQACAFSHSATPPHQLSQRRTPFYMKRRAFAPSATRSLLLSS
jgi:hypothetical protein